jgi:hypothetical protein
MKELRAMAQSLSASIPMNLMHSAWSRVKLHLHRLAFPNKQEEFVRSATRAREEGCRGHKAAHQAAVSTQQSMPCLLLLMLHVSNAFSVGIEQHTKHTTQQAF